MFPFCSLCFRTADIRNMWLLAACPISKRSLGEREMAAATTSQQMFNKTGASSNVCLKRCDSGAEKRTMRKLYTDGPDWPCQPAE